jgi:zinc protease
MRVLRKIFLISTLIITGGICGLHAMEKVLVKDIDNGLQYAIWEDHRSNVVEIRIYVKTGSVFEEEYPGSGISHFLEHITAEGPTLQKSKEEVDELMLKFGNAFNAYTSKGHTCYHITTTSEFYKEALELLGELVFENKITEEAYKRERGVILREIEKSDEEPHRYLYKLASENMYKIHPSKYPVIGYKELFKQIKMDDLVNYYNKKYVPNNAVVVIGGNIDTAETKTIINEKFSSYKRNFYSVPTLPSEPRFLGVRERYGVKDIEGTYLNISWLTIPLSDPDLYALDLLSEILSSGRNSRLNKIIKEKKQLVNSIDSYSHTPAYGKGDFTISATFKDTEVADVEKAIFEIIKDIQENGVTKKEIERSKKLALSAYLFERTSVSDNTSKIGADLVSTSDENFSYIYVQNLRKVTADDVQEAARKYLNLALYARTMILSEEAESKVIKEYEVKNGEPEKIVLDNGINVILKKIDGLSVTNYAVFFEGGQTYNKYYEIPGLFSFFGSMMSRGTKKYDRETLADEFEKIGAGFSTSSGNNTFYVKAASLSEDYEKVIGLLDEIINNPLFPEEEIEKHRKFTLQAIAQQKNNWQKEAYLNYKKHIFPSDMPYIYSSLGTTESVAEITRKDLIEVHNDFIDPSNMVVSVVGDYDMDEMKAELKKKKKALPDVKEEVLKLDKPEDERYSTGKELAVIFQGYPTVTIYNTQDRVYLDVIDALISGAGYPSGWLHDRLRSRELVYVTHAYNTNYIKSGCFTIFAATNPQKLDEALKVIDGVMDDLKNGKYTDKELQDAKEQILIMHELHMQTPASQAENYALNELLEFGYDFDDKYLEMIKKTERKDIAETVDKYFKNAVRVVTSPEVK